MSGRQDYNTNRGYKRGTDHDKSGGSADSQYSGASLGGDSARQNKFMRLMGGSKGKKTTNLTAHKPNTGDSSLSGFTVHPPGQHAMESPYGAPPSGPGYGAGLGTESPHGAPPSGPGYGAGLGTESPYGAPPSGPGYGAGLGTESPYRAPPSGPGYGAGLGMIAQGYAAPGHPGGMNPAYSTPQAGPGHQATAGMDAAYLAFPSHTDMPHTLDAAQSHKPYVEPIKITSANKWEKSELGDDERKNKFLRLMGAARAEQKGHSGVEENKDIDHGRTHEEVTHSEEELQALYRQGLENRQQPRHAGLGFAADPPPIPWELKYKQDAAQKEDSREEDKDKERSRDTDRHDRSDRERHQASGSDRDRYGSDRDRDRYGSGSGRDRDRFGSGSDRDRDRHHSGRSERDRDRSHDRRDRSHDRRDSREGGERSDRHHDRHDDRYHRDRQYEPHDRAHGTENTARGSSQNTMPSGGNSHQESCHNTEPSGDGGDMKDAEAKKKYYMSMFVKSST